MLSHRDNTCIHANAIYTLRKPQADAEPVSVTVTTFPTTYIYTSWELLIPYFLACT